MMVWFNPLALKSHLRWIISGSKASLGIQTTLCSWSVLVDINSAYTSLHNLKMHDISPLAFHFSISIQIVMRVHRCIYVSFYVSVFDAPEITQVLVRLALRFGCRKC